MEDVVGSIPIDMGSSLFTKDEIREGIVNAGKENLTSYGGCGPIATMGMLDFFARNLGFTAISSDPGSHSENVKIATEVMETSPILPLDKMPIWFGGPATAEFPQGIRQCFNQIMRWHGLEHVIQAYDDWTVSDWCKDKFYEIITSYIDKGIPVTFATAIPGKGRFQQHTVNIYAYHSWIGTDESGKVYKKQFLEARLNANEGLRYCFDADLLQRKGYGIVVYDVKYTKEHSFAAKDLKHHLVNESGNGQYNNQPKEGIIEVPPTTYFNGKWLRTSYIENQYLTLSPNRDGAGTAYFEFTFAHAIQKIEFTAALWNEKERFDGERLKMQYWLFEDDEIGSLQTPNKWFDHIEIKLANISKDKNNQKQYVMYFPSNVRRFRFLATQYDPFGNRNLGRVCLDNFRFLYC